MLLQACDATRERLTAALGTPELAAAAVALDLAGVDVVRGHRIMLGVSEPLETRAPIQALAAFASGPALDTAPGAIERLLLLRSASRSLQQVPGLPVSDDVKRLLLEAFDDIAAPRRGIAFDAARGSFVALAKLVTLRRFPAGQFHWERSGIPRSWVLKVKGRERLALLYMITKTMKGFAPVFFIHLNAHRKNRFMLTEREADRSYRRMAESMRLQPDIKGLVASSWLNSRDTFAVSPHLEWMNRTFVANGALEVTMGPADPDSGVLARSPERRRAYESGAFRPTTGLVVWPREAMLAWADAQRSLDAPAIQDEECDDAVASHAG